MVDNSGSTSCSIILCLGTEIFVQIDHILTKFCPVKVRDLLIMTHHVFGTVVTLHQNFCAAGKHMKFAAEII